MPTAPKKKSKASVTPEIPAEEPSAPASEYQVLARKYRPGTFSEVVGQDIVVRQLQGDITDGRIGHAYLFTGPRGVGKTSMARIFAKAVDCIKGPTPNPCLKCAHCTAITTDSDLDVVEVDAATYTKKEETIELLQGLDRVSFSARYKVYIIDEVHMFSNQSFNVLLKRLEEPPPGVIFILATTNPEKLPETVVSRCRRLEFDRMAPDAIVGRLAEISDLETVKFKAGERDRILEAIALASEGGMRDAQVALDQMMSLSEGEISLETARQLLGTVDSEILNGLLVAISTRDTAKALTLINELVEKGRDVQKFTKVFTSYLRDAMLLKAGASEDLLKVSRADAPRLRETIQSLSMPSLLNSMQQFLELEERMRGAAPPRFLLEFAIIKLTAIHPRYVLDGLDANPPPRSPTAGTTTQAPPKNSAPMNAVLSIQPGTPAKNSLESTKPIHAQFSSALAGNPMAQPVMRRSAPAAAEPFEPVRIEVGEAATAPDAIEDFKRCLNETLPHHLRIFKDADVIFDAATGLSVVLRSGDGIVRPQLDKPEIQSQLRTALRRCFGGDYPLHIRVAERSANIIPMVAEAEDERYNYRPAPADASDRSGSPFSRKLSLKEAVEKFPEFKDAIDLVRKHCDALPEFFNGQRVQNN